MVMVRAKVHGLIFLRWLEPSFYYVKIKPAKTEPVWMKVKEMAYLALYREWRPRRFQDLVGQEHVKRILTNALISNKVAHAYLFSGPRGTGKTTAAKILAKALNCAFRRGEEPCNECDSCQGIDQGQAMDVLEIDAASNRGIDEIRNLRENVKLAATSGEYKVYIIDEVHMLTAEAFNALLKTLEEPPTGVVFIMATTEPHKVPLTILSRVQRFEFHRISPEMIVQRLQEVCDSLDRKIAEEALMVIASKAEGGLRDALSILDQCLLHEGDITLEFVFEILGVVGESFSADLLEAILGEDCGLVLTKLNDAVAKGRDPRQIIRELLEYLRQGLLFGAGGREPMLSPQMKNRLTQQVGQAGIEKILALINVLLKGEGELRAAPNARLSAEMVLVQAVFQMQSFLAEQPAGFLHDKKSQKQNEQKTGEQKLPRPKQMAQEQAGFNKIEQNPMNNESRLDIAAVWPQVLEGVRKKKKSTHAFLLEAHPERIEQDKLVLVFKEGYSFHRDKFEQPENRNIVEEILGQITGIRLSLHNMMENEVVSQSLPGEKKLLIS